MLQDGKIKKAVEHIWEYYKVPLFGLLAILFIIWALDIPSLLTKPAATWNVYEVNSTSSSEQVEQRLEDYQGLQAGQGIAFEVFFDDSITFSLRDPGLTGFDQMAKFTALIAAKEIDILIGDFAVVEHYGSRGGFVDLAELIHEGTLAEWKENLVYLEDASGGKKALAIRLPLAEEKLAAIPLHSENKEISVDFLKYIQMNQE